MTIDTRLLHKSAGQLNSFRIKNEILYVLDCADELNWKPLGRKHLQKIIYLTHALAPLREIVISFLKFYKYRYGPYTHEIQNTLNNLIALGLVELISMEHYAGKNSTSSKHQITKEGKKVVKRLTLLEDNQERYDWIRTIIRLIDVYGLENLVDMVYQEPTFKSAEREGLGRSLDIDNLETNLSVKLIEFLKKHGHEKFNYETTNLEIVLISFFEYLYSVQITEKALEGGKK
ncbi:hypothetical protein GOV13_05165 [Candidatus Pacearchaeota archaeon]|nr:hypothetical protein [Candidatus Pacearchaeota archaeon]